MIHDTKHNGDFILEYYVKNTEDIEIISKQIVEENVFIFRAYNLSDINVVWKSVDDISSICVIVGLLRSLNVILGISDNICLI